MQTTLCALSHEQVLFLTARYTGFDDPMYLVSNIEQRASTLPNPQIGLEGNLTGFYLRHSVATGWEFVYWENHAMRRHFYGVCPGAGLRTREVEVFTLTLHQAHQIIWLQIGSLRSIDRIYEHSDGNWMQIWEQGQSLEEQSADIARRRKERMNKERRAFCRGVLAAQSSRHRCVLPTWRRQSSWEWLPWSSAAAPDFQRARAHHDPSRSLRGC